MGVPDHPHYLSGGRKIVIKRKCLICGKEFLIYPSIMKYGKGSFCSKKCYGLWQTKNRKGEKARGWRGGKIECVCKFCKKVFYVFPSCVKRKGGVFCSKDCWAKSKIGSQHAEKTKRKMSKNQIGKKNSFYGHSHTEENKKRMREARGKTPKHHTKPERIFEEICRNNNLPFKYTGDSAFWIHNINPDFIECNGKKIAVEVFGDYWHSPLLNYGLREDRTLSYRKKILKKYGWKLIVFWETDLLREDAEAFVLKSLNRSKLFNNKEGILEYI